LSAALSLSFVFGACSADGGPEKAGGSNTNQGGQGAAVKPNALKYSATYEKALSKVDEIIAYCDANRSGQNPQIRGAAIQMKQILVDDADKWDEFDVAESDIGAINMLIRGLT
jgi:hypothetical protein